MYYETLNNTTMRDSMYPIPKVHINLKFLAYGGAPFVLNTKPPGIFDGGAKHGGDMVGTWSGPLGRALRPTAEGRRGPEAGPLGRTLRPGPEAGPLGRRPSGP